MNNQDVYPHGWHSQLGPSRSRSNSLVRRHDSTSLASYLPTKPPYSPKALQKFDTDTVFPSRITKKVSSAYDTLQIGPIELADANNGVQHVPRREQPIPCRTVATGIRAALPNQRTDHPLDTLSAPQETQFRGNVSYPNMLDINRGSVPRYSAPAWMAPSEVQTAAWPPYHPPYPTQPNSHNRSPPVTRPSFPPYPVTPEIRPGTLRGNYGYSTIACPSQSLDPRFGCRISHRPASPESARGSSTPRYEIDGQEIAPKTALQSNVTATEPYRSPNTSPCIKQHYKEASKEVACRTPPTEASQIRRQEPVSMGTQARSYSLNEGDDVAVSLPNHTVSLEHDSALAGYGHTGFVETPAETNQHTPRNGQFQRAQKITEKHDSFYTPANGRFYLARPYTQLNQRLKEFRLLRVHPRKACWQHYCTNPTWDASHASGVDRDQGLLACEIEKTSLTRVGDNYITLSYCAGDPHKTGMILVDGIPFNAFANLEHAINRLSIHWTSTHPDGEPLLLWADQISINQSDKDERSQQVQIMREIYRRSSETYVCLSVPTIEDCLSWTPAILACSNRKGAMPSCREVHQGVILLQHLLLRLLGERGKIAKSCGTAPKPIAVDESVSCDGEPSVEVSITTFQTSLASFITNPWWRRYV